MNPEKKNEEKSQNSVWISEQPAIQPAAYDVQGRPLYYAPPSPTAATIPQPELQPQANVEPAVLTAEQTCTPLQQKRHEYCKKVFPDLDLNEGEYVLAVIKRHPIGIFSIWAGEVFGIIVVLTAWLFLMQNPRILLQNSIPIEMGSVHTFAGILIVLFLLIGWIGSIIFNGNRFYLTNERVVQFIMSGLFSTRQQTINLKGVEDVSYSKFGIIQTFLNYGSIRMSTIGDENTYRFSMVDRPEIQTRTLNGAVQACKKNQPTPEDLVQIEYNSLD